MSSSGAHALEFRHLRAFVAVAETLHFGRAAERLSMTQPPLSLAVQQLEARLGARLFDRQSKGVQLTAAGQAFLPEALALLALMDDACRRAREVQAGQSGRLRLGFVGSMVFRGLPQWLKAFAQAQPGVAVQLDELNSQEQLDALRADQLDLGFVHTRHASPDLQALRVHVEPFMACLPASHPLAEGDADRPVALSALTDEPLVLFSAVLAPDYHRYILDLCAAQGFRPVAHHGARHWLSVVALVGQGMGVSVVPASLAAAGLPGAVLRPLAAPGGQSEVHAVWRREASHPARDRFLAHLRSLHLA